jgi:dolichol-phosphate mannosyltransferase
MTNPNAVTAPLELEVGSYRKPPWRRSTTKVLVVLPAYNEQRNLGPLLEAIDGVMSEDDLCYEVVIIDDGSTDCTFELAETHANYMPIKVLQHEQNMGLGAAMRTGLQAAASISSDNDIVVVMDADNTQTPGLIPRMMQYVREGADVVIASRYQHGSLVKGVPFYRRVLSFGASMLFRTVFPIPGVKDFTCGYRAYRSSVLKTALAQYGSRLVSEEGFQCMVDLLLKLRNMDLIFREVPLILRYDAKQGASKMKVVRTVARTLGLIVRRFFHTRKTRHLEGAEER